MTTIEIVSDVNSSHRLVGQAHVTRSRGQVSTTFLYDPTYLADGGMNIDPALSLVPGAQYQSGLIGAFADSAPDRWGRNLIRKAERSRARDEGRVPRQLDDLDFLLGVSDDTRQGALRFRASGSDEFLGEPSRVPRLVALPELLHASDELASDDDPSDAVKRLLDTGTTGLGGARPKASVRLDDGGLAIAKFPHSSDSWDVMAWEATALDLLETAGVRTPQHQLTQVGNRSILILRRFDRTRDGSRIGYISAMTATGSSDGDQKDYADLAEAIRDLSRPCKTSMSSTTESSRASPSATLTTTCATTGSSPTVGSGDSAPSSTSIRIPTPVGPVLRRSWEQTRCPTRSTGSWLLQTTTGSLNRMRGSESDASLCPCQDGGARRGQTESPSGRSP